MSFESATVEELLAVAMEAWRDGSESVHHERCSHRGGVEVCDPGLIEAERRAAELGIDRMQAGLPKEDT